MFDWIFGPSEEKKKELKPGDKDYWLYDYMAQYLSSPLWRNPILEFIDQFCFVFQDVEENKLEYTSIHKKFKAMIEKQLKNIFEQMNISEELFEKIMRKGINDPKRKKIFQQVLVCDNFTVFKRTMLKRNKEIDVQALKSMGDKKHIRQQKELQKMNIEQAIAFSKAVQEKIQKVVAKDHKKHEQQPLKHKKQQQEDKKLLVKPTLQVKADIEDFKGKKQLPPLQIKAKYEKPIENLFEQKEKLQKELKDQKVQTDGVELIQQRKKRLQEQRQKIRKTMQNQRKKQMQSYANKLDPDNKEVSEQEMERRANLMRKLREQLN